MMSLSVFLQPIAEAMGWSRTGIATAALWNGRTELTTHVEIEAGDRRYRPLLDTLIRSRAGLANNPDSDSIEPDG